MIALDSAAWMKMQNEDERICLSWSFMNDIGQHE